jgi:hypothetical protein
MRQALFALALVATATGADGFVVHGEVVIHRLDR